jgi:hypothetical protein
LGGLTAIASGNGLNWGLPWEHDAPIPNDSYISAAINELRDFRFANELDCGPSCGSSDVMISGMVMNITAVTAQCGQ